MKSAGYVDRERAHFDRLAKELGETGRDRLTPAAIRRLRRRAGEMARLLSAVACPRVLEIGVGAGAFSQVILEALPDSQFVGCDISPNCIEIAREKYGKEYSNASFQVSDCSQLEYEANSFDCICGCSILHHLPHEECLTDIFRALKPGGFLWFSEPNMLNPIIALQKNVRIVGKWAGDTEDETAFFRWPLRNSLSQIGFVEAHLRPFDFLHPFTPRPLIRVTELLGRVLEHIPLAREFAGSLIIEARKPQAT